jgi:hypothetical protein
MIAAYGELGVSRLLKLLPSGGSLDDAEAYIRANAPAKYGL